MPTLNAKSDTSKCVPANWKLSCRPYEKPNPWTRPNSPRRPGVSRIDGAAQRPTAIVGAAPWTDAGWEAIAAFAGRNDVPVCSSCRGFDIVPSRHHCIADQLSTCASMPTN
jgi:thiamine pyrophosphate-dependent acetolactate synthase large subunit-like protein